MKNFGSNQNSCIGKQILHFDEVKSTNDLADQLAQDGASEGTVVLAEYQTCGRGRLGRTWVSPKGKNILLSVILRPEIVVDFAFVITLMSSVAVARTLSSNGFDAKIKWPNDIYIEGKKVAGLLTEVRSDGEKLKYLVLGIGINVNMGEDDIPSDLKNQASSLFILKNKEMDRSHITETLLYELEAIYALVKSGHYEKILKEWSALSFLAGKWVKASIGSRFLEGVVMGIDSRGALLLKLENGLTESVLSGDVSLYV